MKRASLIAILLLVCSSLFAQSAMDYYNMGYKAHDDQDYNTSYTYMGYAINGLTGEYLSKAHWYRGCAGQWQR